MGHACAGKFGGIFASLPQAMVSGLFCIMFGLISAVGVSQLQVLHCSCMHTLWSAPFPGVLWIRTAPKLLCVIATKVMFLWLLQFADQNSPRTSLIAGFGLYMSLSIPDYFTTYAASNPGTAGPINTSNQDFNSTHILSTPMRPGVLFLMHFTQARWAAWCQMELCMRHLPSGGSICCAIAAQACTLLLWPAWQGDLVWKTGIEETPDAVLHVQTSSTPYSRPGQRLR